MTYPINKEVQDAILKYVMKLEIKFPFLVLVL